MRARLLLTAALLAPLMIASPSAAQPPASGTRLVLHDVHTDVIDVQYTDGRLWLQTRIGSPPYTFKPAEEVIFQLKETAALDRHDDLADADLLPAEHLVDSGYVSVGQVLTARDQYGLKLTGPLPPDTSWQAAQPDGLDLTHFAIDWDAEHVVCPNGKISRNWQHAVSRDGLPLMRATFRLPDCRPCPDRPRCTRSENNARHITFLPRRKLETQQQLREEQSTKQWWIHYNLRCGVESLIAQASRRSDIHHARYRSKPKTFLQHILTAMALNLIRIDAWLTGAATFGGWTSRLTRLSQALAAT